MFATPGSRTQGYKPRGRYRYVRKIYSANGTYTWNAPRDLEPWTPVNITVLGAGASGGGVATTASTCSTGGGGGGLALATLVGKLAAGQAITITVGAGGAPPTAGANPGNAGSTSSFGSLVSATGGTAGGAGSTAAQAGSAGGTGSGGDLNITGGKSRSSAVQNGASNTVE